jgi:hypothetical protein
MLSSKAGGQRFLWDMRYEPLNEPVSYPMTAVKNNTAPNPTAPWVMPGLYKVKLTANGQTIKQPLEIVMDPRVKTSLKDLQRQHDLSIICYEGKKKTKDSNPALYRKFDALFGILNSTDMAPTSQTEAAVLAAKKELGLK